MWMEVKGVAAVDHRLWPQVYPEELLLYLISTSVRLLLASLESFPRPTILVLLIFTRLVACLVTRFYHFTPSVIQSTCVECVAAFFFEKGKTTMNFFSQKGEYSMEIFF
jgi:hypothetical protein